MSLKRSYSPSVQDQMLFALKEPVPLPEAKDVNDFNRDPSAYPDLTDDFVKDLLNMSYNQGSARQLLKISMLAHGLQAYIREGTAPDGNIVILPFDLLTRAPGDVLFFDVENNE